MQKDVDDSHGIRHVDYTVFVYVGQSEVDTIAIT